MNPERAIEILEDTSNFETIPASELIGALTHADDYYHNEGEPLVDDNTYDIAKRYAHNAYPADVYFTGVGSEVRGGKVKLPYQMGSLDQVYEGEILEWIGNWDLQDDEILISDKLDGTSAMIVYNADGDLQIAFSRGNGIEGADITRHIKRIPSVPNKVSGPMVVRAEVIIPIASFGEAKSIQTSRSGGIYKNPRNMVAGIMNAKSNSDEVYQYLDVVAYEIVGIMQCLAARDGNLQSVNSKDAQLDSLNSQGFLTPNFTILKGNELSDQVLTKLLNERRAATRYEIDGLVLDVASELTRKRMNPTKTTLNPAYAVKYKVASVDNVKNVRVVDVEWNVSKHGYLKPRVVVEPVELMGVTIQHATGFNAKFIKDNNIGPGAIIKITRSGDVIPFIIGVIEPGELKLPEGKWTSNARGEQVDLVVDDVSTVSEVHFKQTVDFFVSIDAPNLKEGSIAKLFDKGFDSIENIINAEELDFILAMGKNGQKAFEGLHQRLNNIYFHDFIGSTTFFDRGIGKRRFKKLFETVDRDDFLAGKVTMQEIADVEGFDTISAKKILNGLPTFNHFYEQVADRITIVEPRVTGITMDGQSVCMTGFRDKAMVQEIEANGGKVVSGVSKNTTILVAADPTSKSGKAKKARDLGIMILGIDEFKEILS